MIPDSIERELTIEAPIDVVWAVLTEPRHITNWFSDEAVIDLRPGGDGALEWHQGGIAKNQEGSFSAVLRVVDVQAPHLLSYRWVYPAGEEPTEGNSVLVEFLLSEAGQGTRLRMVERGIDAMDWTDEAKLDFITDHNGGWDIHLGALSKVALDMVVPAGS